MFAECVAYRQFFCFLFVFILQFVLFCSQDVLYTECVSRIKVKDYYLVGERKFVTKHTSHDSNYTTHCGYKTQRRTTVLDTRNNNKKLILHSLVIRRVNLRLHEHTHTNTHICTHTHTRTHARTHTPHHQTSDTVLIFKNKRNTVVNMSSTLNKVYRLCCLPWLQSSPSRTQCQQQSCQSLPNKAPQKKRVIENALCVSCLTCID